MANENDEETWGQDLVDRVVGWTAGGIAALKLQYHLNDIVHFEVAEESADHLGEGEEEQRRRDEGW